MRTCFFMFIGVFVFPYCMGQIDSAADLQDKSKHFTFHINKWINLHHFFYEKASNQQKKHLNENSVDFIDYGESKKIEEMSPEEKIIFEEGILFYKQKVIDRSLLLSGRTLKWLQVQDPDNIITDTSLSSEFTFVLNRLLPIYEKHFWISHKALNIELLNKYIDSIKATENFVIKKMELLSGLPWKSSVRVDLSTYGNWASAYSPDFDNIVISSIDPQMHSTLFLEFTYHESAHLLFLRSSPFRMSIKEKANAMEIHSTKNLWHAAMFYLSGLATKEALHTIGIEHQLIMSEKNVFKNFYDDDNFRSVLRNYYHQCINLDEMSSALLNSK